MKHDEFAFVNMQLAGMLRSGIPLEGALRQLCQSMRRGRLREELALLETDLARGTPLREALQARRLPELYRNMLLAGAQANDLPAALTMLADYYQKLGFLGTRLKGLMVYPMIVLVCSLALAIFLAFFLSALIYEIPSILQELNDLGGNGPLPFSFVMGNTLLWAPVALLGAACLAALTVLVWPPFRRFLRWRLPGFREAGLSQMASALHLMLRNGTTLADALALIRSMEAKTPAGRDVARWQARLAEGRARFPEIAEGSRVIPPLFVWLASSGKEDLAAGFQRAAEIYHARAAHRAEMLLYVALPVSLLFLGVMLAAQAYPVVRLITASIRAFSF